MWITLALASAFVTAVVGTLTKAGTAKVDPGLALAVQATVLAVLAWVAVSVQGKMAKLGEVDGRSWIILLAAGVGMLAANLFYYRALGAGSSSAVQPLDRLSLVFAVLLAGLFLKEKVTPTMLVGVGLMAAGAILIAVGAPPEAPKGQVRAVREGSLPI